MRGSTKILFASALSACTSAPQVAEPPAGHAHEAGTSEPSTGSEGTSAASTALATASSEDTGQPPSDGVPQPTAPCPAFVDGVVEFCPAALAQCREALVVNAEGANGGPLTLFWHGTSDAPDVVLAGDHAVQSIAQMVEAQAGLLVLPYADPAAPTRPDTPFPWWVVCGDQGEECDRLDDFVLADEIVACAVAAELVDRERLTSAGLSAGAIMTSLLVARTPYLAGAVSWSGGVPERFQPIVPPNTTAVMAVHGGADDVYCGPGVAECYPFRPPTEALAAEVAAAGSFAFLCDHQLGHGAFLGVEGAQFLGLAHVDGHPWARYPFGRGGEWVLDHDCYLPGEPSPWD